MILNNPQKNSIWLWLFIAIGILILCSSCASRKVNKSNVTETTKTEAQAQTVDSSKTITNVDSNVQVLDQSTTQYLTLQPLDNTKPMVVNGKSYFNAVLKQSNIKNNVTTNQATKVAQIEQKAVKMQSKAVTQSKRVEVVKNTDRSSFNWWWLLLLLIPLGYLKYKKYI
jgi:subtilisin family serine protease